MDPLAITTTTNEATSKKLAFGRYSNYLSSLTSFKPDSANGADLTSLMEGPIRKKLKIIPSDVR